MAKQAYVYSGTDWVPLASEVTNLSTYQLSSGTGLNAIIPTSVAVGSGTGTVGATGTVTFTGSSSVSLNNCFNSVYDNYCIKFFLSAVTANITPTMRLRASGTDSSTNYVQGRIYQNSSTVAGQSSPYGTDEWGLVDTSTANPVAGADLFLYSPFLASVTVGSGLSSGNDASNNLYQNILGLRHTTTSSYDGLSIIASSGNMTGTIQVYGYKD